MPKTSFIQLIPCLGRRRQILLRTAARHTRRTTGKAIGCLQTWDPPTPTPTPTPTHAARSRGSPAYFSLARIDATFGRWGPIDRG
jgi:hypothetical protein